MGAKATQAPPAPPGLMMYDTLLEINLFLLPWYMILWLKWIFSLQGCLQVIPGSHKGPLYSHFRDGQFASSIFDDTFKPSSPTYLEAPRGSVTLHHARLAHGSAANLSCKPRRIACFIYNAVDAWPLLGVAGPDFGNVGPVDWNLFNSTIVRGQPTMYPRLKDCPVRLPLPLHDATTVVGDFDESLLPQKWILNWQNTNKNKAPQGCNTRLLD